MAPSGPRAASGSPSVIASSTGNLQLKPEEIDSQIIRRIVPAETPRKARGEPTESIRADRGRGRATGTASGGGTRRRARPELGFFGLAAALMLAVGVVGTYLVLTTRSAARVEVHAVPEVSAQVLVDGQMAGRTPLAIEELAPGRHVLTLIAPGFAVTTRDVAVERAADMSLEIALEREAEVP